MISRHFVGHFLTPVQHPLPRLNQTATRLLLLGCLISLSWGIPAESATGKNENNQSPTTATTSQISRTEYQNAATKLLADDQSEETKAKAAELYLLAALDGNEQAMLQFGDLYLQGVRPKYELSPYSQTAPEVTEFLFTLGKRYLSGDGVDQSTENALLFFQSPATAGHTNAQFYLGYIYYTQEKFTDQKEATVWYTRAANTGSTGAMAQLALLYLDQYEEDHDKEKLDQAKELFEKATKLGSGQAVLDFAMQAETGIFPDVSIDRVKQLYQKSSDLGVTRANYRLAMLYLDEGNYGDAIEQLIIADEQEFEYRFEGGIESPKRILARIYATGMGVETDLDKAVTYDPEEALYSIVNQAHHLATEGQTTKAISLFTWAEGIARKYDLYGHLKNIAWYKTHALVLEGKYTAALASTSDQVKANQFSDAGAVRFYTYYIVAAHNSLDLDEFSRL